MLVRKGLAVDGRDRDGRTPLHYAMEPEAVEFLIKNGADVNAQARNGVTPLIKILAQCLGHNQLSDARDLAKFRILLDSGADFRLADARGRTPLHLAARSRILALMERLVKEGADVNARDVQGQTTLHVATTGYNRADKLLLLLDRGADVNAADIRGKTPLFALLCLRDKAGLEALVQHGANVNARDDQGNTVLHDMAGWNRSEWFKPDGGSFFG